MNRQQFNIVLAKFWDSFKQKNPEVATAITLVGFFVVGVSMFANDFGLELPPKIAKIFVVLTTFILSFNNPSTYKTLNPDPPQSTESGNSGE